MPWKYATPSLLLVAALLASAPAAAADNGAWRGYVCRVTDWPDCERNRNERRIYPDQTRYPDQDACLTAFGQRFTRDPQLAASYPQTSDAANSYVFDCEPAP